MRITRETLLQIAKETIQKRTPSDPGLVAAYLTGSLLTENPFLGNATDIDLVFIHSGEVKLRREVLPLTPEVHIDIRHDVRSEYEKPKELRIHPWLGPELYNPMPLYVTHHFFEFVQAGVRDKYHEPANVLARSRRLAEASRQIWSELQTLQASEVERMLIFLKAFHLAVNAIALLNGGPLPERRLLLQFPQRAEAAGVPELIVPAVGLLGADRLDAEKLKGLLPEWEKAFLEAANTPQVEERIAAPRLGYYKFAFEALLASETPQAVTWPLIHTWTLSVSVLPPMWAVPWRSACALLGLDEAAFDERMEGLDHLLDKIEDLLEKTAASQGL
jgi:hypothetical protein